MKFSATKMNPITTKLNWSIRLTYKFVKMMDETHAAVCFFSGYATFIKYFNIVDINEYKYIDNFRLLQKNKPNNSTQIK